MLFYMSGSPPSAPADRPRLPSAPPRALASAPSASADISLLRFLDSNFPGNSPWTREFHLLTIRLCLSQTL